jgi:hypothetical protein
MLVVLPSSFHAVWGSFDDGVTLTIAQNGLAGSFNTNAGRIFPAYWLHNWLLYLVGGTNPTVWYTIQSFEFLLAALLIYGAVGSLSHQWPAAALSAAVLLTSSPISENAYTISKGEPRVTLFLAVIAFILSMILRRILSGDTSHSEPLVMGLHWLALCFAALMLIFSKESAITVITLGPMGVFFSWMYLPAPGSALAVRTFSFISVPLMSASLLLLVIRVKVLQATAHAYTTFTPNREVWITNLKFYVNQAPDILIISTACLIFGAARLWAGGRIKSSGQTGGRSDIEAVLGWILLLTGLAYFFLLLLWRWPTNYYMLPVAACISLSLGYFLANSRLEGPGIKGRSMRWGTTAVLVVVGITRFYTFPYLHFIAIAQRGFDAIEDEVSREVVRINPIPRRVIDVERASFVEQPFQRDLLYRVSGNADFSWVGGGELLQEYPDEVKRLFGPSRPSPLDFHPPTIGDLILTQASSYPFNIWVRGRGPHVTSIAIAEEKAAKLEERIGACLVKLRSWESEWVVYKPWTLQRSKLVFRSVLYKTSAPLDGSATRLSSSAERPP